MATIDAAANFAKATLVQGYDQNATVLAVNTGQGARFPATPFNAVWWNATDYPDPSDDPNREIVRVTTIAADSLVVTRAQEGTSATTKNTAGRTYKLVAGLTALNMNTLATVAPLISNVAANQIIAGPASGAPAAPAARSLTAADLPLSTAYGHLSCVLPNIKYPAAYVENSGTTGNVDLYTCPSGRKALVVDFVYTNATNLAPSIYAMLKSGGTYYYYDVIVRAGFPQVFGRSPDSSIQPMLLSAGESVSANIIAGMTARAFVIEFDSLAPLYRGSRTSFTAGNNTIFTVTGGTSISILPSLGRNASASAPAYGGMITFCNGTNPSTTTNAYFNVVASGGSPAAANQVTGLSQTGGVGGASNQITVKAPCYGGLAGGDFISINTDTSVVTGQFASFVYILQSS